MCARWTSITGYLQIYVNGTMSHDVYAPSMGDCVRRGCRVVVGEDLTGEVSQLAIFDRPLTGDEIADVARRSTTGCRRVVGNLVAWDYRTMTSRVGTDDVIVRNGSMCLGEQVRLCYFSKTST